MLIRKIMPLFVLYCVIFVGCIYANDPNDPNTLEDPNNLVSDPNVPGFRLVHFPQITPDECYNIYLAETTLPAPGDPIAGSPDQVMPELRELARGLKYDPELIIRYVQDNIEFRPGFMSYKGAYMTYMDRAGNCFDQSSLLITLLRLSGYDASYVYGDITLTVSQLANWFGVEANAGVVLNGLNQSLIPVIVSTPTTCRISHIWVKALINGETVHIDPSFKQHNIKAGLGRDKIKTILSYNRDGAVAQNGFWNTALQSTTSGTNYIKSVNWSNIRNNLANYTTNLVNYCKDNPDLKLDDIVGGNSVIPLAQDAAIFQTALPYFTYQRAIWTEIPDVYKASIQVKHLGIQRKLYSSDIYGHSLTLFYNDQCVPILALDGVALQSGTQVPAGSTQTIGLSIKAGISYTVPSNISIEAGYNYAIVNSWAGTGTKIIEKHQQILVDNQNSGMANTSEGVLGESLQLIGFTWVAQCTKVAALIDKICSVSINPVFYIGVCGQTASPYIDMPACVTGAINSTTSINLLNEAFISMSGHNSAFEWGVMEQLQPYGAVSTVKLIDMANGLNGSGTNYNEIYLGTKSNWSTINSALSGYDNPADINTTYLQKDFFAILPKKGNLNEGNWTGCGYKVIKLAGQLEVGELISKKKSGGYGTAYWNIVNKLPQLTSPVQQHREINICQNIPYHPISYDPIDMQTGNFLYDHSDISIGNAFSLGFSRSYRSLNRLSKSPLGNGWSHNYDITCQITSDSFQAMGEDSPVKAAISIVEILVSADVLQKTIPDGTVNLEDAKAIAIETICHRWYMDQMLNNIFVVKQGASSKQFFKLPDGSYCSPSDQYSVVQKRSDTEYRVLSPNGSYMKFTMYDNDPGDSKVLYNDGRLVEIIDVYGASNKITFNYDLAATPVRLSSVSNPYGKEFVFTYNDSKLLQKVQEKIDGFLGKDVSFAYDADQNLLTYTDIDGKVTRYVYNGQDKGLLEEIYYPANPNNPYVVNVFDSLKRVMNQTNADGYQYQYYYADARTEEIDPEGYSKIYQYDNKGLLLSSQDEMGRFSRTEYDGYTRKILDVSPTGVFVKYHYDKYSS